MKQPKTEFSRPLRVSRVPITGCIEKLQAEPAELEALARRFAIPAVKSLKAQLQVEPARGGLKVEGKLWATVVQLCVVTLEEFEQPVEAPVERYFVPAGSIIDLEFESAEEDFDPIENDEIDLGELVAENLGLALDPYPRRPGVAFTEGELIKPEDKEPERSPFAALQRLKAGFPGK
jgi:uncharacterized metal-binding protein YceD (DUF177 family)